MVVSVSLKCVEIVCSVRVLKECIKGVCRLSPFECVGFVCCGSAPVRPCACALVRSDCPFVVLAPFVVLPQCGMCLFRAVPGSPMVVGVYISDQTHVLSVSAHCGGVSNLCSSKVWRCAGPTGPGGGG